MKSTRLRGECRGPGSFPDTHRAGADRPARLHEQQREDDEQPAGGRQDDAAVVSREYVRSAVGFARPVIRRNRVASNSDAKVERPTGRAPRMNTSPRRDQVTDAGRPTAPPTATGGASNMLPRRGAAVTRIDPVEQVHWVVGVSHGEHHARVP